ncbi:MAG: virulence factor BrkB family protein [Pseudomonadota bacterium]
MPPSSLPQELTAWDALTDLRWMKSFIQHLWQHFGEVRCFDSAAVLSYTTLLAIVPLMAVVVGVVSAFPVFDYGVNQLQDFVFENFVPAAGNVVREYLDRFVENSAGLTSTGTGFLIVTAILMMATIEKSLNRIWRVEEPRRLASRLLIYWSVLTLGPLLIGASLGLTSYLVVLPDLAPEFARSWAHSLLLSMTPFLIMLLAFALIFIIVPNRRVQWNHALVGALISAILFELSKHGFVFYISNFPTYERLYGALATMPIFLIWIYLSWLVILLGASVTAALTTFSYQRADWRWDPRHHLVLAVRLLGHLWQAQRATGGLSPAELMGHEPGATDADLQMLLTPMSNAGLVHLDERGDWFLSTDLAEVTLGDLYHILPFMLPIDETERLPEADALDLELRSMLNEIDQVAGPLLQRSLKSYVVRGLEAA